MAYSAMVVGNQITPFVSWKTYGVIPTFDSDNPTGPYSRYKEGLNSNEQFYQLKIKEEKEYIAQPYNSEAMLINPYVNMLKVIDIEVDPKTFSWINEEVVRNTTSTENISTNTNSLNRGSSRVETSQTTRTTIETEVINASVDVPENKVKVMARDGSFNPYENVEITVKNTTYRFVVPATSAGGLNTTITVGGDGNLKSGITSISASSAKNLGTNPDTGLEVPSSSSSGSAAINYIPLRKIITNNLVTIFNTLVGTRRNSDPLSQTFLTTQSDVFLSSLDIIFDQTDMSKIPSGTGGVIDRASIPELNYGTQFKLDEDVRITFLETYTGQPDLTTALYSQTIPKGTIVTNSEFYKVKFNNALFLLGGKEYAFIVETVSQLLKCRVAKLGGKDIKTKYFISSQPYPEGVLLSSSNKSTWTAHQNHDMTFILHSATFMPKRELKFKITELLNDDTINFTNATDFMLMATENYQNSFGKIDYVLEVETGNGVQKFNVNPFEKIKFDTPLTGVPTLVIKLYTSNENFTPTLLRDIQVGVGSSLLNLPGATKSIYVTENIQFNGKKYLQVYFDLISGNTDNIEVYYSTKEANINTMDDWTKIPHDPTTKYNPYEEFYKVAEKVQFNNYCRVMLVFTKNLTDTSNIVIENLRVLARI